MPSSLAGGCGLTATTSILVTTDDGDVVVGLGAWWRRLCVGAAGQPWRLSEEFPLLRGRLVALIALGNLDFAFALVVLILVNGVACGVRRIGFSGCVRCLVQRWIHVLQEALDEFQLILRCGELES